MIQTVLQGFEKPKSPNLKRMHCIGSEGLTAKFICHRCNFVSDWISMASRLEINRGLPCPFCNLTEQPVNVESPHTITSGLLSHSETF